MTSIKIKYRPSVVQGKEGTLYYQIIHRRVVRQFNTYYHLYKEEWNADKGFPIVGEGERAQWLLSIQKRILADLKRWETVVSQLERNRMIFTADDIVMAFKLHDCGQTVFEFMQGVIAQLEKLGKSRTAETYTAALNSFKRFRVGRDLLFDEMNSDLMLLYEAHLHERGIGQNSISFYNRILRATYNRAVEKGLTEQRFPFKRVYTGIAKTVKRAIGLEAVRRIKHLDLSLRRNLDWARDLFLFSFYTRGMSFVDMAYLRKRDLNNGFLTYRRRKTRQLLTIRWEKCMQEIVDKYDTRESVYLLPIIKKMEENERRQYKNAMFMVNRKLKIIGKMAKLTVPLTMYVARHTWATAARNKHIPLAVISECMGHDSELTTQIYLASLDTNKVDEANSIILDSLD